MTANEISLIRQALLIVELREVHRMDSFPNIDAVHSTEYLENMSKLTTMKKHESTHITFSKRKLIACIIAAALLLFATACAFYEPILNYFQEVFGTFTKFSTDEDVDQVIEETYVPQYIPEGYTKTSQSNNKIAVSITWENGEDKIIYYQNPGNKESTLVDTENSEYSALSIKEQTYHCYFKNNTYIFLWENDHYSFKLKCYDTLSLDEIKKILGSVTVAED